MAPLKRARMPAMATLNVQPPSPPAAERTASGGLDVFFLIAGQALSLLQSSMFLIFCRFNSKLICK